MARFVSTIDLSGPFFRYDPVKRLSENTITMLEAYAREGRNEVRARADSFSLSGAFARGVAWYVRPDRAVIFASHVYPWPAGGAKQYRGGKHEARHGFFRKTRRRLNQSRAVNRAELTKGMN